MALVADEPKRDSDEDDEDVDVDSQDQQEEPDEDDEEEDEYEDEDEYEAEDDSDDDDEQEEYDDGDDTDMREAFQDEPSGAEQTPLFFDEEDPRYAQGVEDVPLDEGHQQYYEEGKEKERRGHRRAIIVCLICCCILILAVIGAVLGLVVFGNDDGEVTPQNDNVPTPTQGNDVPTYAPVQFVTIAPVIITSSPTMPPSIPPSRSPTRKPTAFPTVSPTSSAAPTEELPERVVLTTNADSSIQNGLNTDESLGRKDNLYVQNGELDTQDNFDSYALIAFDLTLLRPRASAFQGNKTATLVLQHVPSDLERGPAELTVFRLPETPMSIETLNGRIFVPKDQVRGPTFSVAPSDELLQVDISDLAFGIDGREPEDQLFLKLENMGAIQIRKTGDSFRSREFADGDFAPQVVFTFVKDVSDVPTSTPTLSMVPTSVSPGSNTTTPDLDVPTSTPTSTP
jgi:hypothetical protein